MEQAMNELIIHEDFMVLLFIVCGALLVFWVGFLIELIIREVSYAIPTRNTKYHFEDVADKEWLKKRFN